jgi:hypothetical protein
MIILQCTVCFNFCFAHCCLSDVNKSQTWKFFNNTVEARRYWWYHISRSQHLKHSYVTFLRYRIWYGTALTLLSTVTVSIIYRFGHTGAVIASYSYCSKLIDQRYCSYSFSLFRYKVSVFQLLQFLRLQIFSSTTVQS